MTRLTDLLRAADPASRLDLPRFDTRAEEELARLVSTPEAIPARPQPSAAGTPRMRPRALLAAAAIVVVVIAGSATAIIAAGDRPAPAASGRAGLRAERVVFYGSPEVAAAAERLVDTALVQGRGGTQSAVTAFDRAVDRSPQLRFDAAPVDYAFSYGYRARGDHRFDFLSSGYGQDAVQVILVRCSGSGSYRWEVTGRVGASNRARAIASATGRCGNGITAGRYVLRDGVSDPVLTMRIGKGVGYTVGAIEAEFGAPILDSPYPKG